MKKNRKYIYILTLLLIAGVATWFLAFRKKEGITVVTADKPATGYISQSVTATGTIQPVDTVAVGTQVSGTIDKIYADFNTSVKKGQLLAELDKTLFQASVNQGRANLEQAQSQEIYQAGNFDRQKQLYTAGAISKADYENALYTYNSAKASVKSLEAQLQTAQKNLSLASIFSPIDGTVLSRAVSVGQTVAASFSTPTLFTIAKDITKMQVKANVDEADIGNIANGQRATFTVDAFLKDVFKGKVQEVRLSPTTSSNVVTYTTLVNANNDDEKLKPGMTANISIFTKEVNGAMLIPAKALKYKPEGALGQEFRLLPLNQSQAARAAGPDTTRTETFDSAATAATVWVKQDHDLVQKAIRIGLNDNTHVEVLSGLEATDEVVTGSEVASGETPVAPTTESSPFMPKRPGRASQKK